MSNSAFICFLVVATSFVSGQDREIASVRVESCSGCSLNRLTEVKKFVYNDIPLYENIEFKSIHGAPPEMVLLNADGDEVQRLPLSHLSRRECNELLVTYGLKLKDSDKNPHLEF